MRRMHQDIRLVALHCEQVEALILGWVLACIGSGVSRVTVVFGVDINNELSRMKQDICQVAVYLVLQFRNLDSRGLYGYVIRVAHPLDWFC